MLIYCVPYTVLAPVTGPCHSYSRKGNILRHYTGKNEQYTKGILHENKSMENKSTDHI